MKTTFYILSTRCMSGFPWHRHANSLSTSRAACLAAVYNPTPTVEETYHRNAKSGQAKITKIKVKVLSRETEPTGYDWRASRAASEALRLDLR